MNQSESITALVKALIQFQAECPNPSKNRRGDKGAYANIADYLEAAQPVLAKHKLAVTQLLTAMENGQRALQTTLLHETGEFISSVTPLPEPEVVTSKKTGNKLMSDTQRIGNDITYFRRYAYAAILGMASEDNDGGAPLNMDGDFIAWAESMIDQGHSGQDVIKQLKNQGFKPSKTQTQKIMDMVRNPFEILGQMADAIADGNVLLADQILANESEQVQEEVWRKASKENLGMSKAKFRELVNEERAEQQANSGDY